MFLNKLLKIDKELHTDYSYRSAVKDKLNVIYEEYVHKLNKQIEYLLMRKNEKVVRNIKLEMKKEDETTKHN